VEDFIFVRVSNVELWFSTANIKACCPTLSWGKEFIQFGIYITNFNTGNFTVNGC
jgi:hypothetical protein